MKPFFHKYPHRSVNPLVYLVVSANRGQQYISIGALATGFNFTHNRWCLRLAFYCPFFTCGVARNASNT